MDISSKNIPVGITAINRGLSVSDIPGTEDVVMKMKAGMEAVLRRNDGAPSRDVAPNVLRFQRGICKATFYRSGDCASTLYPRLF